MTPTPNPQGSGGKVLTAFLAGAMLGAFSMVQFAPAGGDVSGQPLAQQIPLDQLVNGTTGGTTGRDSTTGGTDGTTQVQTTDGSFADDPGTGDSSVVAPGDPVSDGTADTQDPGTSNTSQQGPTAPGGSTPDSDTSTDSEQAGTSGPADGSTSQQPDGSDADTSDDRQSGSGVQIGGEDSDQSGAGTNTNNATSSACNSSNNGGATDTGITASEVKVAATVVNDGPGASLLQPASIGMRAVLEEVNQDGGICGRRINLTTRNDSWDASTGRQFLNRFIEDGMFALLVVPSSEGLAEAIKAGDISRAGIPVVGTTGLRIDEYDEQWVFPVATATISIMRILAKHAYDQGDRTFGIVYDSKFKFGIEGKDAFVNYLNTLGSEIQIKAVQPLDPDAPSYGTQAQKFNGDCNISSSSNDCDMVALLLVPETAQKWADANSGANQGRGGRTYGAQTLFTGAFATRCGSWCDQMVVWTGYAPPLKPFDQLAGVRKYVEDVKSLSAGVDTENQFLEGAYLGAQVFVAAVDACSPQVTRACIRDWLNSTTYETDLVSQLDWSPDQRHANKTALAYAMEATGGQFNGWQYKQTDWIRDPTL